MRFLPQFKFVTCDLNIGASSRLRIHPQPYLFKTLHLGVREAEDLFGVVLDDGGGHSPRRGVELGGGGKVFSQNFILFFNISQWESIISSSSLLEL